MQKTWVKAPCKVNLALDILGARPDGYHEMHMIMQTVSLCDRLAIEESGTRFRLQTEGDFIPAGKKTMEESAAEAFFAAAGKPMPPLMVVLEKQTPAYAGLGGGSADVAALLRFLRSRYAPDMPPSVLEEIGLRIGSDVPFCLRGGTALARGRGEILTDLPALPACWFVICKPAFGIATPELFAKVDRITDKGQPDISGMEEALRRGDLRGVTDRLDNVFERVLPDTCREVFFLKERLLTYGAMNAVMSGSGPTVFGIFEEEEQASAAAARMRGDCAQVFLAQPVEKFPDME